MPRHGLEPQEPHGTGAVRSGWEQSLSCCPACVPGALGCSESQLVGLVGREAPSNTLLLRLPGGNYPLYLECECFPNV